MDLQYLANEQIVLTRHMTGVFHKDTFLICREMFHLVTQAGQTVERVLPPGPQRGFAFDET